MVRESSGKGHSMNFCILLNKSYQIQCDCVEPCEHFHAPLEEYHMLQEVAVFLHAQGANKHEIFTTNTFAVEMEGKILLSRCICA